MRGVLKPQGCRKIGDSWQACEYSVLGATDIQQRLVRSISKQSRILSMQNVSCSCMFAVHYGRDVINDFINVYYQWLLHQLW